MRRLAVALAVLLSFATARAASAADKIAYVDVQRVISEVEEGKAAKNRLRTELDSKRAELDKKQKELEQLKADYDRQAGVLTEEAKQQKQKELQQKFMEAQQQANQMQRELADKEDETLRGISEKLIAVVNEVSEREGFTYVIKKEALLAAPQAADLTNEVVRRYNARFGGGGAKKEPAAQKPAPAQKAAPAQKKQAKAKSKEE
jgi:outer membrane protein